MAGRESEAIRIALQTEIDGLEMYTKAAQSTKYPVGRKMFLGIAEDEKAHKRMIENVAAGLGISTAMKEKRPGTPKERIKTIFSGAKDVIDELVKPTTDDKQALQVAMEFETNGHKMYTKFAAETKSTDEKQLFELLAGEENEHYLILQRAYAYLEDTGHWFLWEEGGLLEG